MCRRNDVIAGVDPRGQQRRHIDLDQEEEGRGNGHYALMKSIPDKGDNKFNG